MKKWPKLREGRREQCSVGNECRWRIGKSRIVSRTGLEEGGENQFPG